MRSRNDVVDTLNIVLKKRPELEGWHVADFFSDRKLERRDGFKPVFLHDGKIKPAECGRPIFDLYKKIIGINMTRLRRTSSIGMPVSEIEKFMKKVLKS